MGTATSQGQIWSARARDWADVQEGVAIPLYEEILRKTSLGAGQAVLDVGCGSGIFCAMAARLGAKVSGIDAAEVLPWSCTVTTTRSMGTCMRFAVPSMMRILA